MKKIYPPISLMYLMLLICLLLPQTSWAQTFSCNTTFSTTTTDGSRSFTFIPDAGRIIKISGLNSSFSVVSPDVLVLDGISYNLSTTSPASIIFANAPNGVISGSFIDNTPAIYNTTSWTSTVSCECDPYASPPNITTFPSVICADRTLTSSDFVIQGGVVDGNGPLNYIYEFQYFPPPYSAWVSGLPTPPLTPGNLGIRVRLKRNDAAGCVSPWSSDRTIVVIPLPVVSITGNTSICVNGTTNLSPITGGTWVSNSPLVASVTNAGLVTGLTAGNATFTFSQTSSGCSKTTSEITVNALPAAPAAGNNSRCGTGTVIISATAASGETIDWYAESSGGTVLTGGTATTSFTTPSISTTTIYYSVARNITTGCLSATRTAVTATVNALPAAPAAGNNSRCGTGTVLISATPGTGETIDWYAESSGGTVLTGGTSTTSFTTPSISTTTIYYSVARNIATGCESATRTAVTATVNALPAAPAAGNNSRCGTGTVIISATPATGETIDWYAESSGGTVLTGGTATTSFTTPSISTTTIYYSVARNIATGCESATRTAVTATVNTLPAAPAAGNNSRCGTGTVLISATPATGETIDWYAESSGGTVLTGGTSTTSFTTPTISTTTIYYSVARNIATGCESATRTSVTATVNALPAAPAAGNNSRCGTGTVIISATPGTGETIDWYAESSGGTVLTGGTSTTSFTTPSISTTTIYYSVARNIATGCESATRTAVTATVNALPAAPATTLTQPTCTISTGIITITAPAGTGMTYSIDGTIYANTSGIFTVAQGTYTVTAKSMAGCISTGTSVTINAQPKPATPVITLNGNILHSTAANGNQWYDQNGLINGATNQDFTVTANGSYYVIVTISGCSSDPSNAISVVLSGENESLENNKAIKVYPNPFSNELVIEIENGAEKTEFEILNNIGQKVFKGFLFERTIIQTDGFSEGVYIIKIKTGKTFEFKKIVK